MSGVVIRFPPRRIRAVVICPHRDGDGWLTIVRGHGWLYDSLEDARRAAQWLARNFGLPIREALPWT